MKIQAKPVSLRFSENKGYRLEVKIVEGPVNLIGKFVCVQLTRAQLDKIAQFAPDNDTLDLVE